MTNEIRELSDAELNTHELELVTGGSPCTDASAHFKEAARDFASGKFFDGVKALCEGNTALNSCFGG